MCLAQGHKAVTQVRLEPENLRSQVKHSTIEPSNALAFVLRHLSDWITSKICYSISQVYPAIYCQK